MLLIEAHAQVVGLPGYQSGGGSAQCDACDDRGGVGTLFLLHPGGGLDAQRLGGHGKGELFQCPAGFKFLRVIGVQRAVQDGPAVKHHAGGHPVGVGYQPDGGVLFQRERGIACGGSDVHPVHIHERAGDVQRIGIRKDRRVLFPLGVNFGIARDGLGKVKLCGVGIVGIPVIECITLCRQLSGVGGGSVILNILAGGCFAVLGDKAYFVILGCPLGVNRGVARDGLGKVKLYGAVLVGIPAIECKALYRGNGELVGVDGFAMFNRLIRKRRIRI